MKKRILMAALFAAVLMSGCAENQGDEAAKKMEPVVAEEKTENTAEKTETEVKKEKPEDSGKKEESEVTKVEFKDDFDTTLSYIKRNKGKTIELDYKTKPDLKGRVSKYEPDDSYIRIEDALASGYKMTRCNAVNKENGALTTVDIYRNSGSSEIEKISTVEFGCIGRLVSGWYFKDGNIIYEYRYSDDLYGTGQHREEYSLVDDHDDVMLEGYTVYDAVQTVPGYAKVYGYVSDVQGGLLENVYAKISSIENNYEEEVKTNGDGYYEVYVPVNTADWYNISFTYGDFTPGSINDINITPGVAEYSCGVLYMAPEGQNRHESDIYLMNINKKAPDKLGDGEYEAVLEYEDGPALLKPYFMSMSDGKSTSELQTVFKPSGISDSKFFVVDIATYGKDNMSYNMSKSNARVTIYDKNGIVACYTVPAGRPGVVWEAFEVRNGQIIPSANYYFETVKDAF